MNDTDDETDSDRLHSDIITDTKERTCHRDEQQRSTGNKVPAAVQPASGWKYTVDGLETNVEYTYTVTAKDSEDGVICTKTGTFTTQASEGIDNVQNGKVQSNKFIRDGVLYIERGGKMYNAQGAEVM